MLTGYALATAVNVVLTRHNLKNIPAQMIYRYIKDGRIPSVVVGGQKLVRTEDAKAWTSEYVQKRLGRDEAREALVAAITEVTDG